MKDESRTQAHSYTTHSRFLPSNYPETLEFIVTNVTHTLKNNQWVTSIDSIASVANIFTTKELEDSSALPENFQPISIIPGFGQGALALTNVNSNNVLPVTININC